MSLHLPAPVRRDLVWDALRRRPLAWAALAAGAGILLSATLGSEWGGAVAIAGVAIAIGGRPNRFWVSGGLLLLATGLFWVYAGVVRAPAPGDIAQWANQRVTVRGVVDGKPRPRRSSVQLILRVTYARSETIWKTASGRIVLYSRLRPDVFGWGDIVEADGVVRRPRPPRNPGGFDTRAYWARRGVHATLHRVGSTVEVKGHDPRFTPRRAAGRVREALVQANRRALSPRAAHLANSILFGDRDAPPQANAAALDLLFYQTGTIHLLVVSGAQVAILIGPLLLLGLRLGPRRWAVLLLVAPASIAYAFLAGLDPSVTRAAVMAIVYAGALVARRRPDPENVLGVSALILLTVNPLWLEDLGFILSFAAVWALFRLTPLVEWLLAPALDALPWLAPTPPESMPSWIRGMAASLPRAFAATAAVYLCVAPILAHSVKTEAPITLVANVAAGAYGAVLLWAAAGHLALLGLGWSGNPLGEIVEFLSGQMLAAVEFFARQPGSARPTFPLPVWAALFILAGLMWALWALPRERRATAWGAVLLALGIGWLGARIPSPPPAGPTAHFIDVGQGDATLLRYPDGTNILIDGGPSVSSDRPAALPEVLSCLLALRIDHLDAVVLTHPDGDHLGGLPRLLATLPVGGMIDSGIPAKSAEYVDFVSVLKRRRIPRLRARAGGAWQAGGATLEFLAPLDPLLTGTGSDDNNNSVVVRAPLGHAHLLLPGDAEEDLERTLLSAGAPGPAGILKLGHHGSKTSSSADWLRHVRPQIAVVSAGRDNRFGHPDADVLARARAFGAAIYRTDLQGMVTIEARNGELRIRTHLPPGS